MCLDPVTMAVAAATLTMLTSAVSQKMEIDNQNKANAANYNNQARYAERVNQAALAKQREADSRSRINTMQQSQSAADKARATILENQKAMGAARASAGTSGLMGLPLNMIEQNYNAMIGGVSANLDSYNTQLDQNLFFDVMDHALTANSTTNQAIPGKPYMQKFGIMNAMLAVLQGASAGVGAYNPGSPSPVPNEPGGGSGGSNTIDPGYAAGQVGDFGTGGETAVMIA